MHWAQGVQRTIFAAALVAMLAVPALAGASHFRGGNYYGKVTTGHGGTVTLAVSEDDETVEFSFNGLGNGSCMGVGFSDITPIVNHGFNYTSGDSLRTANGTFGPSFVAGGAQVLTTPCTTGSQAWIVKGPDGFLETEIPGDFLGLNVLNPTGEDQTQQRSAKRGRSAKFDVGIANQSPDSTTFLVKGCKSSNGFKVSYRDETGNVTNAITDGSYETDNIASSEIAADFHALDLKIKALNSAEPGKTKTCKLTSDSGLLIDVIKAKLKVQGGG